ncbi:hypothetical protein [Parendozoicomonas haliclonae]|uniref:Uncharacterized protein n=1 Tax=Parendozoicomonas haliclonae TaxID=1960125 RepID=A0A1X7AFU9_9GAMM|nr:hypothetical protein [Parendozoicomonas haliclonae]SMA38663.1 hypothetical protein EHSB41UT_00909 [Parendozoicomonas haliclonae]
MTIYSNTIKEIQELTKSEAFLTEQDVTIFLNRCSEFESIAAGIYAEVYNLPDEPDRVVKVCTDNQDGYYLFARWCMLPENISNPHLPIVHREDIIELPEGRVVRIYVLERLTDITDEDVTATCPTHFHDIDFGALWVSLRNVTLPFYIQQKRFADEIKSLTEFIETIKQPVEHLPTEEDNSTTTTVVDSSVISEHEAFIRTLFDVLTFISPIGMMDLNGSNCMLRGDTVVITDPIGHKYAA